MQKTEIHMKQLSIVSRVWKTSYMTFLFFMAVMAVFSYVCEFCENIYPAKSHFLFRQIGLAFVFFFLNVCNILFELYLDSFYCIFWTDLQN